MHELVRAVLGRDKIVVVIFVHLWIRGREARINVLRSSTVLGCLALLHALEEGLLDRSVLVECAAHEISRIRQIRGIKIARDSDGLWVSSAVRLSGLVRGDMARRARAN
jgi:hypothetical protein